MGRERLERSTYGLRVLYFYINHLILLNLRLLKLCQTKAKTAQCCQSFVKVLLATLAMPLSARHAVPRSRYTDAPPPAPTAA